MTLVEVLLTLRWWELVAFSRGYEVNRLRGNLSFEVFADVAFVGGHDGVGKRIKKAWSNPYIVFVRASQEHLTELTCIVYTCMEPKTKEGRVVDVVMSVSACKFSLSSTGEVYDFQFLRVQMLLGCYLLSTKPLDGEDNLSE